MRATSELRVTADGPRWTPAWVVLISFLTPASAWAMHTVVPDLVAWYVGVMGWLIFTPQNRPRWVTVSPATGTSLAAGHQANVSTIAVPALASTEPSDSLTPEATTNQDANSTKARKARTRAKKPKALTLAEVKALTSNADRAVVWSQVGPGKFVRQPGDDNGEGSVDSDSFGSDQELCSPKVIDANVTKSTILDDSDLVTHEENA